MEYDVVEKGAGITIRVQSSWVSIYAVVGLLTFEGK
jgi:hypothetical protein